MRGSIAPHVSATLPDVQNPPDASSVMTLIVQELLHKYLVNIMNIKTEHKEMKGCVCIYIYSISMHGFIII